MVDFSSFDLVRLAKVMTSLRGQIDRTDYFERGTILEKALEEYSGGQLSRINGVGVDFKGSDGLTYEGKITPITKKPRGGPQISGFVLKNWRNGTREYTEDMMADNYIFVDINNMKMCVVPKSLVFVKAESASNVTAYCDPLEEHFVELPEVEEQESFFALKDKWVSSLLSSF